MLSDEAALLGRRGHALGDGLRRALAVDANPARRFRPGHLEIARAHPLVELADFGSRRSSGPRELARARPTSTDTSSRIVTSGCRPPVASRWTARINARSRPRP